MPHEKINHPTEGVYDRRQLVVSWGPGWVQASIYPDGWTNTGDAEHVALPPNEVDLLIKTLKRARRKAYANGVMNGFEPTTTTETTNLFTNQ